MNKKLNRRSFVKTSTVASAAMAAPTIIPASAFGANENVTLAIIGPGGRGRGLMGSFQHHGAKFAAVCEVYAPNLKAGLDRAKENNDNQIDTYVDYKEVLDRKDIDAVVIATPEHQHCMQMIDCVNAGFDVYCEKPMSHSVKEGYKTVQAVRKTDRIVQVGMQRRSTASVWKAKEIIDSGTLGEVPFVDLQWNWNWSQPLDDSPLPGKIDWDLFMRPAKRVEYAPRKLRGWRWFWAFSGGNICDQGTHLMDVVQWFLNDGQPPHTAECFGRIHRMTNSECPDIFSATYEFEKFVATWTLVYTSSYNNDWHITFQGTKATMELDGGGCRVFEERWEPNKKPAMEFGGGLDTTAHCKNLLDCIKTREEPNAPVEVGHLAVCGPHMGNVAYHKKRRAHINKATSKVTT